MDGADGFDAMLAVLPQHLADGGRIGAAAPIRLQRQHIQAELLGHQFPQMGKLAGAGEQDAVAGAQCVDQRGFPGAGPRGREDADGAGRLEHAAKPGDHLAAQCAELRTSMIDRIAIHCPQHPVGQVGRAGCLQKVTARDVLGHFERFLQGWRRKHARS